MMLQSAQGIIKCARLLLQSASGITKCYSYKVRRNRGLGLFRYSNFKVTYSLNK